MFMRLGFSVAMHVNPDVLLLDEILAVGDESFQQKCFGRVWDYRRAGGTIVFVSHDATSVERICDRAILLEHGEIVAQGAPEEVFRTYHRRLAHTQPHGRPSRDPRASRRRSRSRRSAPAASTASGASGSSRASRCCSRCTWRAPRRAPACT